MQVGDGCVTGVFRLVDTEEMRATWNGNRFELLYTVVLSSKELKMELAVTNKGERMLVSIVFLEHHSGTIGTVTIVTSME